MLTLVKRSGPADSGAVAALAPLDEATLIARVRAGDRPAQDEFYRRFKRLVAGNLYRVAGDRGDLEDLVQEVFVIAFRGLDRFRGDARLSTWLYRICINVSLGRMRSRSRKPLPTSVADIDANATTSWADAVETPERALVRRQDQARVHAALEQLAPKKRIVLYLHEIEGLDLKDIAYLVDSNAVTVRTRLFYARREFYRILAGQGVDGQATPGADDPSDGVEATP